MIHNKVILKLFEQTSFLPRTQDKPRDLMRNKQINICVSLFQLLEFYNQLFYFLDCTFCGLFIRLSWTGCRIHRFTSSQFCFSMVLFLHSSPLADYGLQIFSIFCKKLMVLVAANLLLRCAGFNKLVTLFLRGFSPMRITHQVENIWIKFMSSYCYTLMTFLTLLIGRNMSVSLKKVTVY